jgi:cytochrome c oxidase subunit 1
LVYLLWSLKFGPESGPNPFRAMGLEWQTPSPPPTENFEVAPTVTRNPYDYAVDGKARAQNA